MTRIFKSLAALAAGLFLGPAVVFAGWVYSLSPVFDHDAHFSAAAIRGGIVTGAYTADGPVRLGCSNADGRDWRICAQDDSRRVESVSFLAAARDGTGVYAGTESDQGASLAYYGYGWRHLGWLWQAGRQYALGGASARDWGYVLLSSGQGRAGCIARPAAGRCFTAPARDADGQPLILWDAAWLGGRLYVGAALGDGQYHRPDAGRIMRWEPSGVWTEIMRGIGPVIAMSKLKSDPGGLYACTAQGRVYRTDDGDQWTLWFDSGVRRDVRLVEIYGEPFYVSAAGVLWDAQGNEVMRLDDAANLTLVRDWTGSFLAGPVVGEDGATRGVRVWREAK